MPSDFKEEEDTSVQGKSKMAEGLDKGRTEVFYIGKIPRRQSIFQVQRCVPSNGFHAVLRKSAAVQGKDLRLIRRVQLERVSSEGI